MKCLPNEGGLFQQERAHVLKMRKVLEASDQYVKDHDPSKKEQSKQRLQEKIAHVEDES